MTRTEFYARALALTSATAKAAKLEIAADLTTDPAKLHEIRATARDLERLVQGIAMPIDREMARRRFIARARAT
jgi:hypothetical protein